MSPRFISLILSGLLVGLCWAAAPGSASANTPQEQTSDDEESYRPPTNQGTGFRLGFLINGLIDTEQGRSFRYFDLGVRQKVGEYYIDIRTSALFVIVDGLLMLATYRFRNSPEPLLITLNDGDEPPTHWEMGHGRLGYRFRIIPPGDYEIWTDSLEAAVGVFASADMVSFESRRDISQRQVVNSGYDDFLVLGAGGFFSVGRTREHIQYDVAIGVGMALRGESNNPNRSVYIASIDADLQFELGMRSAFYIRPRLTAYLTDLDPAINLGTGLTAGLNMRF